MVSRAVISVNFMVSVTSLVAVPGPREQAAHDIEASIKQNWRK